MLEMGGYGCRPGKKVKTSSAIMASSCSKGAGCHCSAEKTMAWLLLHISPRHALAVSWEGQVRWGTILPWAPKAVARLLCRLQGGLWVRGLAEKGPRKPARRGRAGWWGRGQHLRLALSHANSSQPGSPTHHSTFSLGLGSAPAMGASPTIRWWKAAPLGALFPHQGTCPSGKGGGNGDSGAMGVAWGKELVLGMAHLRSFLGGLSSLPAEESAPTSQCSRGAFHSMKTVAFGVICSDFIKWFQAIGQVSAEKLSPHTEPPMGEMAPALTRTWGYVVPRCVGVGVCFWVKLFLGIQPLDRDLALF